jgi:hypothetical protein
VNACLHPLDQKKLLCQDFLSLLCLAPESLNSNKSQPGQIVHETLSQKKPKKIHEKELVEWLKM